MKSGKLPMAEENADKHPTMDMGEHLRTWRLFVAFFKWHLVAAAILLLILLAFRTNA
jgi:hypothetical protein